MKKVDEPDGWVKVTLSRRNLSTLLNKLDDPSSAKTLFSVWDRVIVCAEEDDVHYVNRAPGAVHPAHDPARDKGDEA